MSGGDASKRISGGRAGDLPDSHVGADAPANLPAPLPDSLPDVRAGDAEREVAARRLHIALEEGRLDLMELDRRLIAVYAAKTRAELATVTADLPDIGAAEPIELRTKSGSLDKRGPWTVPTEITAECRSGTIKIDFTSAWCPHREVRVHADVGSGNLVLIVPNGWQVDLDAVRVGSGSARSKVRGLPVAGTPRIRVDGRVGSGTVKARSPRRGFWSWVRGRPM
ncbi:DUF1707 domain-containing protein [Nocardia puris]|uniref:Uncharacterized protein DUF1707 n=1 Tax=Nocardia puris TaxID=208602 RepID=A0A366DND8_9NOCA|nr:DUF1707 domain-containing protein [Nocardia puris]MBF6213618.1 DUF1707 domain-containing protein [Nocardia puris]MBF6365452.1 DUF1707 domain-containing protein [Nocardia puris]MBF6459918.1 DUF1707 domain-containing protein [Nocardia puris]RBO91601.1 uncharacterized protein DUF1707 [Nocardia puris]